MASGKPSADSIEIDDAKASEVIADAMEQGQAEGLVSSLPQIALEIATHARDQGRARRDLAATQEIQDAHDGHKGRREVLTIATQADAIRLQADQTKGSPGADAKAMPTTAGANPSGVGLGVGQGRAAQHMLSSDTGRPGSSRVGTHQTDLKPTVSLAAAQTKTTTRAPAGLTDKVRAQGDAFNATLFAAAQHPLNSNEPTPGEARLHSTEPHTVSPSSSAGLNPFNSPAGATAAATTAAIATVATPMHQPGWNADFGRQVVMLARDAHSGVQTAELRLDPPELGPLRISLSLNEGMASALFVSAHASVRQAVEAALPQLSQQLAQAGISLGETHVGDQGQAGFGFSEGGSRSGVRNAGTAEGDGSPADSIPVPRRAVAANALVDTFA